MNGFTLRLAASMGIVGALFTLLLALSRRKPKTSLPLRGVSRPIISS